MNEIEKLKLVPVVKIDDLGDADLILGSLCEGGLPCAEITFRTECCEKAILFARKHYPHMLVGAGTVVNETQARRAYDCGAAFVISPGFSEPVAAFCRKVGLTHIPGCATPTEIMRAGEYGSDTVKFFPAGVYGGLKALRALHAPFPNVKFIPTGGVSEDNLAEYLAQPFVAACGGSWMIPAAAVKNRDGAAISSLVKRAVAIANLEVIK